MTDEQRATLDAAQAKRKKAKYAYDKAFDGIQPLRMAWINADARSLDANLWSFPEDRPGGRRTAGGGFGSDHGAV